jgi:predicted ATPase/transcriptional regulator with XRE-family HTH domain
MTETSFGTLLRRHRIAAGLTQEALAARAGLSTRGISDLERGARELPRKDTLQLLLQVLDLAPADRAALVAAARRSPPTAPRGAQTAQLSGLPVALTPLVGREADVAAVSALLTEPTVRLLTLTGPGGTGKTRLALAVAERLAPDFPDGVTFVPLAALGDPSLVASAITQQLGVREAAGQTLGEALTAHLRDKRLLLVLDNVEHLLPAAPLVTELLGAARSLNVLVTSRVRLRLSGEREVVVPPLALPSLERLPASDELALVPAVQLFVARAQDVKADFALTDENGPAVAEICQRLDGLPLALELAAARVKILSPAALLARLDRRLPLLTGGAQDLPDRQQTLRQTIAWSHDLLSAEERILFRRLAVFSGSWTLQAAEGVEGRFAEGGEGGSLRSTPAPPSVLDGIASLVDKSLVRQSEEAGDEPRFTMLETIREFGLEQLHQHPDEEEAIRTAHARYFFDLAMAEQRGLRASVPDGVKRMRPDEDNYRAMLAHLLEAGESETALHVAGASLSEYWLAAGARFTEARAWLDRALRQGDVNSASPAARAWGHYGVMILAIHQQDLVAGRAVATEGVALAQLVSDPLLRALSLFMLALVEEAEGRLEIAEPLAVEAVQAARISRDLGALGWPLIALGRLRWHAGDLAAAAAACEEARDLFHGVCGIWGECDALATLASVAMKDGIPHRAAQLHRDALRLRRDSGVEFDLYNDLLGIAEVGRELGQFEAATRILGAEETYRTRFGYEGIASTPRSRLDIRQALMEQLGATRFRQAWEAGQALSTDQAIDEALALAAALSGTTQ